MKDEDGSKLAAHDTRLGQLQRGRGAGYLAALAAPGAARDEVLQCIVDDPRIDREVEYRDRYYAELMVALDVPIAPITTYLASQTPEPGSFGCELGGDVLANAWRLGHGPVRAMLAERTTSPAVVLRIVDALLGSLAVTRVDLPAHAVEVYAQHGGNVDIESASVDTRPEPPTTDASMTLPDLLALAEEWRHGFRDLLVAALSRRNSAADRDLLAWHVQRDDDVQRVRLAAKILGLLGDTRLLALAEDYFGREDDFSSPARMLPPEDRTRRAALSHYFDELPREISLPLARLWHSRRGYFCVPAGHVLSKHAEPCDREWLERCVLDTLPVVKGYGLIHELEALAHLADPRSAPVLIAAAEQAEYANARRRALAGLGRMSNAEGAGATLREAMWDCDDFSRETACAAAPIADAQARARLMAMTTDPLADDRLRAAASARVSKLA